MDACSTSYLPPASHLATPPDSPTFGARPSTSLVSLTSPSTFEEAYEVLELIGSGGYGSVVKAARRSDGMVCAVKLISRANLNPHRLIKVQFCGDDSVPGMKSYGKSVCMVPVEVYALRRIVHDGIVGFVDLFQDEAFFYLAMEYHGSEWLGGDLSHKDFTAGSPPNTPVSPYSSPLIRRSSSDLYQCIEEHRVLSEDVARYVFAQIVETVQSLLDHGIVHCDLKDQNFCIDSNWKVKLIDFGSAVIFDPETSRPPLLKGLVGTRRFSAPEILKGEWYDPVYSEVWALGIILSVLLTGDIPFSSEEGAMSGERPLPRNKISREARDLMSRCLEIDVNKRIKLESLRSHPWLRSAFA
ncbi:hypothetical protein P7C70_g8500, partial [Phenoliferia sp. Uapishka_3]